MKKNKDYTLAALAIPFLFAVLFNLPGCYQSKKAACNDCWEMNCIYQEINDSVKGEGSDIEIEQAIQDVCKSRNISDTVTIDLLRAEYYL